MSKQGSEQPKKAYEVERISRTVTTLVVYANDPEQAKRRSGMGVPIDAETEGRGFGRVRRMPERDRP